jgi:hypothetical protein
VNGLLRLSLTNKINRQIKEDERAAVQVSWLEGKYNKKLPPQFVFTVEGEEKMKMEHEFENYVDLILISF